MKSISTLLKKLKKLNEANDFGGLLAQDVFVASPLKPLRALGGGDLDLSPMLVERFRLPLASEYTPD